MKKIYKSILFTLLASVAVTSCDSYEAPDLHSDPAVTIVGRDTDFPAAASTGIIKFEAEGPVTVTSAHEWLSATVEGDEIHVSCTQNNSLQSRSGILTVKCSDSTTEISIIQEGIIFQLSGDAVKFTAAATSKEFAVKSNAPVELTSDSDWLSASFADGVITIKVLENPTMDPRNATLTASCGESTSSLPVMQEGIYLKLFDRTDWNPTDGTGYLSYSFPYDIPVGFSSEQDWLSYTLDKEKALLRFIASPNSTGHIRTGSFDYTIGPKSGTIKVHQCDFAKDLASDDYALYFVDPKDNKLYYLNAGVRKQGSYYYIDVTDEGLSIPVLYDTSTHTFTIKGGQNCGVWNSQYYIFTTYSFNEDGKSYYTWSTDPSMKALPYYEFDVENNLGYTAAEFEDAGTFDAPLNYFQLYAFSSDSPSSNTSVGYLYRMVNPFLMRIHADATPSASPAKAPRISNVNATGLKSAQPAKAIAISNDGAIPF